MRQNKAREEKVRKSEGNKDIKEERRMKNNEEKESRKKKENSKLREGR